MLKQITEFYEREYNDTKRFLKSPWCGKASDTVWYATQRCLGVAQFVQIACNVSYEDIEPIYNEYREKFEKLLDN